MGPGDFWEFVGFGEETFGDVEATGVDRADGVVITEGTVRLLLGCEMQLGAGF